MIEQAFFSDGNIENKIEMGKTILKFLKTLTKFCKDIFFKKGKTKDGIIIKDQETIKQVLPELEKESKKQINQRNPDAREFLREFEIILQDGKYKIITKGVSSKEIVPIIKSFKEKEADKQINIISYSSAEEFSKYKREKKKIPKALSNTNKFSNSFQSLLALSSHANSLMLEGKRMQSLSIKSSIREVYGEEGLRFCNCYSVGYVEMYLKFLKGKSEKEIEEEMWNLSKKSIFFVSNPYFNYSNVPNHMIKKVTKKIIDKLVSSMNYDESYIAIHSLGTASLYAEMITEEISKRGIDDNYESIRIDRKRIHTNSGKKIRDFSYIWYKDAGKKFYNIFKDLWT